jgi:hypothetical protein
LEIRERSACFNFEGSEGRKGTNIEGPVRNNPERSQG